MKNSNLLRYKGYSARPEFIAADGIFYGTILGIDDLIDFMSENAKELESEFQRAVDDYLAFCQEIGKTPQREYSGTFNVRVSPDLHKIAALKSQEEGVTLNKTIENALRQYLEPSPPPVTHIHFDMSMLQQSMKKSVVHSTQTHIPEDSLFRSSYLAKAVKNQS